MLSKIATVAALAAGVLAHGTVTGVTIDGKFEQGYLLDYYYANLNGQTTPEHIGWYAEDLDNGFVAPDAYGGPDIICHKAGSPKLSVDTMASVAAGGTVEFHWTNWPTSHMGPVITYVAPYTGDVLSVDKTALKWTKIQADGYADGQWAAVKMISQNNTWPVTVPASLAAGKYVFRHEIIALHGAGSANGAQNYPQCLNIEVTGSGTESPEGVVGTKLYTADEAGILFNPYAATIDYTIPGPALFGSSGSGSGSGSGSSPSNGSATATPTSAPATSAAATSAAATSAAATSAAASSPAATSVGAEASPTASSTPAPSSGAELPKTFTIETFIKWLEETTGSSSNSNARRHARALFF